jgi:predicted enzyme related to lactoylglutathione lyase
MRRWSVIHLELHTDDSSSAESFFSQLFGWRSEPIGTADTSYVALSTGDRVGGGIVECGARPAQWVPYVVVDQLDDATARAGRLGASVLLDRREGSAGWRSVVSTPEGGTLALWQPKRRGR